ncbi:hypothetical protein E2C01_070811 [Portunus trituberculatus]|uniref:Uncharacterized protein n=1 Tax=Portunus trituberculatus TaxID=210409 RepID=A0A5B7HTQ9_PORTR|nr:hypothetical protein [Portunus trituberculatus]
MGGKAVQIGYPSSPPPTHINGDAWHCEHHVGRVVLRDVLVELLAILPPLEGVQHVPFQRQVTAQRRLFAHDQVPRHFHLGDAQA